MKIGIVSYLSNEVAMDRALCMAFSIGDAIAIETNLGCLTGIITKVNRKTVWILCDKDDDRGQPFKMKVSPAGLRRIRHCDRDG